MNVIKIIKSFFIALFVVGFAAVGSIVIPTFLFNTILQTKKMSEYNPYIGFSKAFRNQSKFRLITETEKIDLDDISISFNSGWHLKVDPLKNKYNKFQLLCSAYLNSNDSLIYLNISYIYTYKYLWNLFKEHFKDNYPNGDKTVFDNRDGIHFLYFEDTDNNATMYIGIIELEQKYYFFRFYTFKSDDPEGNNCTAAFNMFLNNVHLKAKT